MVVHVFSPSSWEMEAIKCEFKASQVYKANFRIARSIQLKEKKKSVSKEKRKTKPRMIGLQHKHEPLSSDSPEPISQ